MSTQGSDPALENPDLEALARRMLEMAAGGAVPTGPATVPLPHDAGPEAIGAAALAAVLAEASLPSSTPPGLPHYGWLSTPEGAPTAVPTEGSRADLPPGSTGEVSAAPPAGGQAPEGPELASLRVSDGFATPLVSPSGRPGFTPAPPADLPYFVASMPVPGGSAPAHPAPYSDPFPAAALPIPGSDLRVPAGSALTEGIDPSFVSIDSLSLRPGGRDVPPSGRMPAAAPDVAGLDPGSAAAPAAVVPGADLAGLVPAFQPPGRDAAGSPTGGLALVPGHEPAGGAPAASPVPRQGPRLRDDFPILGQQVNGRRLVWLDNAATTQKPNAVIDAISRYYRRDNSNVHRGAHTLAGRATAAYEDARETVRRFLGAGSAEEIVFVRGTSEGINLVANVFGRRFLRRGDEIVVSTLEHHSNIVPWQMLCERTGAVLRAIPVDDRGELLLDEYDRLLGPRTRLVAVTQVSNALGTLVPVEAVVALARRRGVPVLVDGAQAVAHLPVNVRALDADFYVFSGHKIYGPTGIGVVYGKRALLEELPPWQGGGNMIDSVSFESTTYAPVPAKFEAGTAHIAGAVGLAAALEYVDRVGRSRLFAHEQALMAAMVESLRTIPGLTLVGNPSVRVGAVSFLIEGYEPREVAQHLDRHGIAVRAGHHCAQPILRRFGLQATVRPSLGMYNEADDVEALIEALRLLVSSRKQPERRPAQPPPGPRFDLHEEPARWNLVEATSATRTPPAADRPAGLPGSGFGRTIPV